MFLPATTTEAIHIIKKVTRRGLMWVAIVLRKVDKKTLKQSIYDDYGSFVRIMSFK